MVERIFQILWLTLREIFDESAYARYLQHSGKRDSRESYLEFLEQKAKPLKCC
jgi:hypothetical protein